MQRLILNCIVALSLPFSSWAQYPPPAGQPGSTAIYKDSSIFVNWAKSCSLQLGYINIVDTSVTYAGSNKANWGVAADALGIADNNVVSLGDAGIADLGFDPPVANGAGFDFAVFENGMSDDFLELGFVEVSSDGVRYVRFPSVSLTPESPQVGTFGTIDATKIYNLAGKYRAMFGTPFDLEELKDSSGIDLMHITHIRVIDVVGNISSIYTTFDSQEHKINDPWPTEFYTGGFDLDAVGVFHENADALPGNEKLTVSFFPDPIENELNVKIPAQTRVLFRLVDSNGTMITEKTLTGSSPLDLSFLEAGFYMAILTFPDGTTGVYKLIKR